MGLPPPIWRYCYSEGGCRASATIGKGISQYSVKGILRRARWFPRRQRHLASIQDDRVSFEKPNGFIESLVVITVKTIPPFWGMLYLFWV